MDRKARRHLGFTLAALLLLIALFGLTQTRTAAAVFVESFTAQWQAPLVHLNWTTAQEVDNVGFNILRSTSPSVGFGKIASVPSCGPGGITGCSYSYQDQSVTAGQTYYYNLQSVDSSNQVQQAAGPVCAQGNTPCTLQGGTNTPPPPTATKTKVPPTATRTPQPTKTRTPIPTTAVPTNTAMPVVPTATDLLTATDIAIPTDVPTETDVPLASDVPTETDVPPVTDGGVDATPTATKFAYVVGSQPTVVLATTVPDAPQIAGEVTATETEQPTPSPEISSTFVAVNTLGTPRATLRAPNPKSKVPPTVQVSASDNRNWVFVLAMLGVGGLGAVGFFGLVGFLYWYLRRVA